MTLTTRARLTGTLLCSALAIALVGAGALPASAATPVSDGAYYLYDSGTETRFPAGHVALWDDDLVASPSSRDPRAHFTCAADAESVQTFISPVGTERTRASWIAYADSAFFFGTKDVLEPSANLGAQVLGSAGQARARGGDYSVGLACLKFNGVQFASAGLWFTTVHVTAGSGSWTADQAPDPLLLTSRNPTVTGSAVVGQTLTGKSGSWGPAPVTLSYQWNRNDIPITGATSTTYKLVSADLGRAVSLTVRGTKSGYETATTTSTATSPVLDRLTATATPTIAGTTTVGSTLTAKTGTWSPSPVTFAYQWNRNGVKISGATKSTYLLTAADAQAALTVTVTGSKAGYGSVAKTSAPTATVAKGSLTTTVPTISGTAKVGTVLAAKRGTWGPTPITFTYTWKRSGTAIAGATGATYTPVAADAGKTLIVTVTGTKSGYVSASKQSAGVIVLAK
ncbi:hypothetical protein B7R54_02940 [Subtercola boreus]|uniref:Ig-like domain-containing protein n=1 Tax=Subtercola boreus TaxID=120213 RepID=A0A3E0VF66_9MICO|nr:hypothetical protein [Subtercola boreus]RFA08295.1 hypothetical protein B7R54_02940 [Subtercola boreus]TQL54806.1 hypothetical protein FB464_2352 [Subtercola boreus]